MNVTDVAVLGGGVVGLAVARELSKQHRVVLVERHARFATETSGRNSGVIHAGLYYPPGSAKSRLCRRGHELLYAYCEQRGIAHRKTGKLVVACVESERAALESLLANAHASGATETRWLDEAELRAREPLLVGVAAMHSPATGIVDAQALTTQLLWDAREAGCDVLPMAEFVEVEAVAPRYRMVLREPDGSLARLEASAVVNATGLAADATSARFGIDVEAHGLRIAPCKGDYFVLSRSIPKPNTALVYPVPSGAGLGIHLTSDLGGMVRAGPDAEWVDAPSYNVDESKLARFGEAVRRYFPSLRDEDLAPDFAGVRPKLARSRTGFADFVVEECSAHGRPGYVQLVGIESPGLTAALAIAEEVARHLAGVT